MWNLTLGTANITIRNLKKKADITDTSSNGAHATDHIQLTTHLVTTTNDNKPYRECNTVKDFMLKVVTYEVGYKSDE